MQGNYGSRFLNQWKTGQQLPDGSDVGIKNAMATWAKKLAGFADMPDAIKAVLDYLPPDPPSLPEFVNLCREAGRRRGESMQKIEHKQTAEEKAKAEQFAKKLASTVIGNRHDFKAWAKKLKARHETGKRLSALQISAYQEALAEPDPIATPEVMAA